MRPCGALDTVRGAATTLSEVVDSVSGVVPDSVPRPAAKVLVGGRGSHSFTSELNLSNSRTPS